MDDTITPTILETILAEYPDALTSVEELPVELPEELPEELLARYPDAREALHEIFDLARRLEEVLVPVKPRADFVRELKLVLVETPPTESGERWLSVPKLTMAGVVAIGAGISIIALRPVISSLRGNKNKSEATGMLTV